MVVGDGNVGKTTTLMTYTSHEYPREYVPTVFDRYVVNMEVRGTHVDVELWDTAGSEDYDKLRLLSYPGTDVVLVCFSLVSRASFDNVSYKWVPEIARHCPGVPYVLAGTMLDHLSKSTSDSQELLKRLDDEGNPPISLKEGKALASKVGAEAFVAYSSRTQENLKLVFEECTKAVIKRGNGTAGNTGRGGCVMS